jgi:16S rRNA (guanine527-N7)-methyltransferase
MVSMTILPEALVHFDAAYAQNALTAYLKQLLQWNTALGLTAAKSEDELVRAHVLDSLAALPVLRRVLASLSAGSGPALIADVGSGAGFPGLPLAAALPGSRFVLIERMEKRADFLRRCITAMHLQNVTVEQCRAEEAVRGRFDVAVFRALHPLSDRRTLFALLGLLKPAGVLAAYKARAASIADEVAAVNTLRPGLAIEVCPLENPWLPDHERHLVLVRPATTQKG